MSIPDSAFADVPEMKALVTQPEDCRLRLSVADLDKVDDLARAQGREYPWRMSNEALEESQRAFLTGREREDLWIFGYGSLIWDPGINAVEIRRARAKGYRRRFCMTQTFDRGSPEHPGLMLALDHDDTGRDCDALVMRLPAETAYSEAGFVWRREMLVGSYKPAFIPCETAHGPVEAVAFLVKHDLPRFVDWPLEKQAQQIAGASGKAGTNTAYLEHLVENLASVGIHDAEMDKLLKLVREVDA